MSSLWGHPIKLEQSWIDVPTKTPFVLERNYTLHLTVPLVHKLHIIDRDRERERKERKTEEEKEVIRDLGICEQPGHMDTI